MEYHLRLPSPCQHGADRGHRKYREYRNEPPNHFGCTTGHGVHRGCQLHPFGQCVERFFIEQSSDCSRCFRHDPGWVRTRSEHPVTERRSALCGRDERTAPVMGAYVDCRRAAVLRPVDVLHGASGR